MVKVKTEVHLLYVSYSSAPEMCVCDSEGLSKGVLRSAEVHRIQTCMCNV